MAAITRGPKLGGKGITTKFPKPKTDQGTFSKAEMPAIPKPQKATKDVMVPTIKANKPPKV